MVLRGRLEGDRASTPALAATALHKPPLDKSASTDASALDADPVAVDTFFSFFGWKLVSKETGIVSDMIQVWMNHADLQLTSFASSRCHNCTSIIDADHVSFDQLRPRRYVDTGDLSCVDGTCG